MVAERAEDTFRLRRELCAKASDPCSLSIAGGPGPGPTPRQPWTPVLTLGSRYRGVDPTGYRNPMETIQPTRSANVEGRTR